MERNPNQIVAALMQSTMIQKKSDYDSKKRIDYTSKEKN